MNKKQYRNLVNSEKLQGLVCCICGLPFLQGERINREHITPLSRQGHKDDWEWAHAICNSVKANLLPEEFEPVARERYIAALKWNIKHRDKKVIHRVLNSR